MKISGPEKGILALTAAFLLLTTGYFLGQSSGGTGYTISMQAQGQLPMSNGVQAAAAETPKAAAPTETPALEADTWEDTAPVEVLESAPATADPVPTAQGAEEDTGLVNINTAGAEELQTLPGIGAVRAQAIINDRESNGPYRIPEDITRVSGIGEGILAKIIDYITVE